MSSAPPPPKKHACPISDNSTRAASSTPINAGSTCPSTEQLASSRITEILCPNLRIGVNQGLLKPDQDGWVSVSEMKAFLTYIGIRSGSAIQNTLVSLGESSVAKPRQGYINLVELKGHALDHGSSSGILNNPKGFSQQRLEHLLSFSSDGLTLTASDLACAANDFHKRPANFASTKGTLLQTLELSSLLRIYGQQNSSGQYIFSFEDVHDLWQKGVFPKHWQQPKPARYGTLSSMKDFIVLLLKRLRSRSK